MPNEELLGVRLPLEVLAESVEDEQLDLSAAAVVGELVARGASVFA